MKNKIIVFMLLIGMIACFAGCGGSPVVGSDEDQIRAEIKKEIGDGKYDTEEMIESMKQDEDFMNLMDLLGISAEEYLKPFLGNSEISTKDITVDGENATAILVFTTIDKEKVQERVNEKAKEMAGKVDTTSLSEEEAYSIVGKAIVSVLNEPNLELKSEEKIVELSKINGIWELNDPDGIMDHFYNAFGM